MFTILFGGLIWNPGLQTIEQPLRVLEITPVLEDDFDGKSLKLGIREVLKQAGYGSLPRRCDHSGSDWTLIAHEFPAAWFAVRPRER